MTPSDPFADFGEKFSQSFAEVMRELKKPNILIVGETGSGKSSLINAVFGKSIAKTGSGEPVTAHYEMFTDEKVPVVIYDSYGWEGGPENAEKFYRDTKEFLNKTANIKERIHMVWYAIDGPKSRFTAYDQKIIKDLFKDLPVIVVITKGDIVSPKQKKGLIASVEKAFLPNCKGVFVVAADPMEDENGVTRVKPFGLEALVVRTLELLPESVQRAFIAAQAVDLKMKDEEAKVAILKFAIAAGGATGMAPPISDWVVLTAVESTMIARLAIVYGYSLEGAAIVALLYGLRGTFLVSGIAMALSDFLKATFVGYIAGEAIESAVAGTIAATVGIACAMMFHSAVKHSLEDSAFQLTPEWQSAFLKETVAKIYKEIQGKGLRRYLDGLGDTLAA